MAKLLGTCDNISTSCLIYLLILKFRKVCRQIHFPQDYNCCRRLGFEENRPASPELTPFPGNRVVHKHDMVLNTNLAAPAAAPAARPPRPRRAAPRCGGGTRRPAWSPPSPRRRRRGLQSGHGYIATLVTTVLCPSPAKGARPTTMRKLPMAATGARLTV